MRLRSMASIFSGSSFQVKTAPEDALVADELLALLLLVLAGSSATLPRLPGEQALDDEGGLAADVECCCC